MDLVEVQIRGFSLRHGLAENGKVVYPVTGTKYLSRSLKRIVLWLALNTLHVDLTAPKLTDRSWNSHKLNC